jgi:hypothetical protein
MKKGVLFFAIVFSIFIASAQVAINTTGATANASSLLDVSSINKGVLVPRMSKIQRKAIASPAIGLLVFQDATDSIGFHYFNGTTWVFLVNNNSLDTMAWLTKGNLGTDTATNFIGTLDNMPLKFIQNNSQIALWDKNIGSYYLGNGAGINNIKANVLAIGDSALYTNGAGAFTATHGTGNIAIGDRALFSNTQGYNQTAVGFNALYSSINTSNSNTAFGYRALRSLTGGSNNTAIGSEAGFNLAATAAENVAVGSDALRNGTNPNYATAIGAQALKAQGTTGTGVTGIGYKAGFSYSNNDSSTFIGSYSDALFTGLKNVSAIGSGAVVGINNGMVLGKNNVRIGMGTSYPPTNNKVTIKGLGNTNTTTALQVVNSDSTRVFEVSDGDSVKIGSIGTFIKGIIKVKIINYDLPSISSSNTEIVTFTVNGALANAGAVVYISPVGGLINGLVIASVRVSSNNTVEVKFTNTFGLARDQGATDYNIVVIQ